MSAGEDLATSSNSGDNDFLMEELEAAIASADDDGNDENDSGNVHKNEEEENKMISEQISKLLQVHGHKDTLDCLKKLASSLQNRIIRSGSTSVKAIERSDKSKPSRASLPEMIAIRTSTVGSIGNIVIQTLKEIEEGDEEEKQVGKDSSGSSKILIYQSGLQVLQCCTSIEPLGHHFPHLDAIEFICQMMSKYPNNEIIQESCCIGLSEYISRMFQKQQQEHGQRQRQLPPPPSTRQSSSTATPTKVAKASQQGEPVNQVPPQQQKQQPNLAIDEHYQSKILFTVFQAMNIHKENLIIWKHGISVLTACTKLTLLCSPPPLDNNNNNKILETIRFSGGSLLLYQALKKTKSKSKTRPNTNIYHGNDYLELKRLSYRALTSLLVMVTSTFTKRQHIQQDYINVLFNSLSEAHGLNSEIDIILDTMRFNVLDDELQADSMELMAALARIPPSPRTSTTISNNKNGTSSGNITGTTTTSIKEQLLQKGGLDCILTSLKEHWANIRIQSIACRAIANIFFVAQPSPSPRRLPPPLVKTMATNNADRPEDSLSLPPNQRNDDILTINTKVKQKYGPSCIKPLLRAMRMYPQSVPVQIHAVAALQILSKPSSFQNIITTIRDAGGTSTILVAIQQHPKVAAIQEHGWGALFNMLSSHSPKLTINDKDNKGAPPTFDNHQMDDLFTFFNEGGLAMLMENLERYPKHSHIQMYGLGCLAFAATREAKKQEEIMSRKGLDIALESLRLHGCVKNCAHPNHPTSKAIARHGCHIIQNLTLTRDFQKAVVAKMGIGVIIRVLQTHHADINVQLEGTKCVRNLCLDHDNLQYVSKDGGISTLLEITMQEHVAHTLINAYSCDALSHLACKRQNQVLILAKNGLPIVVNAMKKHAFHNAVQDQGCMFLFRMSRNQNALIWMKGNDDVKSILSSANQVLSSNSRSKPLLKELTKQLESG